VKVLKLEKYVDRVPTYYGVVHLKLRNSHRTICLSWALAHKLLWP